ncbi:MAG: ATP-dependent DNA helicase, partial [bacterium]
GFGGFRMGLGQETHTRYREEMVSTPGHQAEVYISTQEKFKDYTINIAGRIDSVIKQDKSDIIQEIKSVAIELEELEHNEPEIWDAYCAQCLIYSYYYQKTNHRPVEPHLILISILDDSRKDIKLPFSTDFIKEYINKRFKEILDQAITDFALIQLKRELGGTMSFPFSNKRRYQDKFINEVFSALEGERHLLLCAPTGIGKTIGSLFPALKHGLLNNRKVFFATPKNSQHKLVLETLNRMIPEKQGIYGMQIIGKEKMCPHEIVFCSPAHCQQLRNFPHAARLNAIVKGMAETGVLSAQYIMEEGALHNICPFELALKLCENADVVVGDYNYVFDPRARIKRLFENDESGYTLILDEAHNLPARARGYLSPEIGRQQVQDLIACCNQINSNLFRNIGEMLQKLDSYFDIVFDSLEEWQISQQSTLFEPDFSFFEDIHMECEELLIKYLLLTKNNDRRPSQFLPQLKAGTRKKVDPLMDFLYNLMHFCQTMGMRSQSFFYTVMHDRGDFQIGIFCADASFLLNRFFSEFKASLSISATLSPQKFYMDLLGLSAENPLFVQYPSPFPEENRLVIAASDISTKFRKRALHTVYVADLISRVLKDKPGNYLAFFPSYSFLQQVKVLLHGFKSDELIIQKASSSYDTVTRLVKDLENNNNQKRRLVLGVQGGVLAEGVDYPGHLASGVIVVSPALPTFDFKTRLLFKYFDDTYSMGQEYALIYPGITRVIQSAGRLIRSETDRGFILFIGERFAESPYKELVQDYWEYESLNSMECVERINEFEI